MNFWRRCSNPMGIQFEQISCTLCSSREHVKLFEATDLRLGTSQEAFSIVQCTHCGLVFNNPRPLAESMACFYPEQFFQDKMNPLETVFLKSNHVFTIRAIREQKPLGTLLDVGCGTGRFMTEMRKCGYQVYGLDPSPKACAIAASSHGERVLNREIFDSGFPDHFFDIITLWHVFEHLMDPPTVLAEIHRLLKPDGMLVVEVPNFGSLESRIFGPYWLHLDAPRHLYHFTAETLSQLLTGQGFTITRLQKGFVSTTPLSTLKSFRNYLAHCGNRLAFVLYGPVVVLAVTFRFLSWMAVDGIALRAFCRPSQTNGETLA